ncbi:MAG: hypothetical protein K8S27_04455 [Candidatus Omnitrophica bacterium]|nr:hypothetical protein [Candidatus Omnitrophota bacterium]
MRKLIILFILTLLVISVKAIAEDRKDEKIDTSVIQGIDLEITLFESIEKVKEYIEKNNLKFEGMYLHGVTFQYIKGHPKKGFCWHYAWNYKKPRMGGEISIFHYMDGTIIVQHHGP